MGKKRMGRKKNLFQPKSCQHGASLVAQMVKNLPAMWESQVQSLSLENPLEKGKVTHFSILAQRIPWTVACQLPLSVEFSRPVYWSGLPFPLPGVFSNPGIEPICPTLQADSLPSESLGKLKNTGVGSLSILQQIFLTQESNWGLQNCRQILYQLSYEGSPHLQSVISDY